MTEIKKTERLRDQDTGRYVSQRQVELKKIDDAIKEWQKGEEERYLMERERFIQGIIWIMVSITLVALAFLLFVSGVYLLVRI